MKFSISRLLLLWVFISALIISCSASKDDEIERHHAHNNRNRKELSKPPRNLTLIVILSLIGVGVFFLVCGIILIIKYGKKRIVHKGRVISLPSQQHLLQHGVNFQSGQHSSSSITSSRNSLSLEDVSKSFYDIERPPPYEEMDNNLVHNPSYRTVQPSAPSF